MASLFLGVDHSQLYSKFRPSPPKRLVEQIIKYLSEKNDPPFKQAVDIGCGTGQSTVPFAPYFQHVTGIDSSEAQIEQAKQNRSSLNIDYKVSLAEETSFADSSVDLVTVAQAVHWFDMPKFFKEVQRILVPNGVVAVYGHWIPEPTLEDPVLSKELNDSMMNILNTHFGNYWEKQRYFLQNRYADIKLPFNNCVRNPSIQQKTTSTVSEYIGYISSWSPYQKFKEEHPEKAQPLLDEIQNKLMEVGRDGSTPEEAVLNLCTDFFVVMGTKGSSSL